MSGFDTSQPITESASAHADELHIHSHPHPDISGRSPVTEEDLRIAADQEQTEADETADATPSVRI